MKRAGLVGLVAAGGLGTCPAAWCQTPISERAREAELARAAKALETTPNRPNTLEAAMRYVEDTRLFTRIFNPPQGWFAQIGGVGEGNGFTMGGGYRVATPAGDVTFRSVASLRESYLVSVDFHRSFLPRDRAFVSATLSRRHEAAQRFSGPGPRPDVDARSGFALSATDLDVRTGYRLAPWATAMVGAGVIAPDLGVSSELGRLADTNTSFTEAIAPGLQRQPTFGTAQAALVVDTRDTTNPRSGGLYSVQLRRFSDRDGGAYSFTNTRVDLQQFVPFWNESRVLALRVLAEHSDGVGGGRVPFYFQPTLGGARSLRGYERQRFRDRSLILLSAEYRYEVNPFLMAAVFVDAGQVAPDWGAFSVHDFRSDYGIGFRFGYSSAVALRTDVAFGGESPVRLIVGFSSSF